MPQQLRLSSLRHRLLRQVKPLPLLKLLLQRPSQLQPPKAPAIFLLRLALLRSLRVRLISWRRSKSQRRLLLQHQRLVGLQRVLRILWPPFVPRLVPHLRRSQLLLLLISLPLRQKRQLQFLQVCLLLR